jgi:hypothetical protein
MFGFFSLCVVAQTPDPLVGTFSGEGVTIDVKGDGAKYSGTIQRGEKSFQFTARFDGDGWVGQFQAGDASFDCSATLENGVLTFKTGDKAYKLRATTAANPLDEPSPTPAPVPAPDAPDNPIPSKPENNSAPPYVQHPNGFQCIIPVGWTGKVTGEFVELFGPNDASTGRPSYYIRAAAVNDPTFTKVDDPAYLNGAIASMKQNEPGLTLEKDPTRWSKGESHLAVIPMKLQVAGLAQPLSVRVVLGQMAEKKVAVVFMACDEKLLTSGETHAIGTAADMVAGKDFTKQQPAAETNCGIDDKTIIGTWKDKKTKWKFTGVVLWRSMNFDDIVKDKDVLMMDNRQTLYYKLDGAKLFVSKNNWDALGKVAENCEVYTISQKAGMMTLTAKDGQMTILLKDENAKDE